MPTRTHYTMSQDFVQSVPHRGVIILHRFRHDSHDDNFPNIFVLSRLLQNANFCLASRSVTKGSALRIMYTWVWACVFGETERSRVAVVSPPVLLFIFSVLYIYIYTHTCRSFKREIGTPHAPLLVFRQRGTRTPPPLVLYNSGHSISPRLYGFSRSHPLHAVPGTAYRTHWCNVHAHYTRSLFRPFSINRSENRHQGLTVARRARRVCRWSYRSATAADRVKNACKCSRRLFTYESFARPKFSPLYPEQKTIKKTNQIKTNNTIKYKAAR